MTTVRMQRLGQHPWDYGTGMLEAWWSTRQVTRAVNVHWTIKVCLHHRGRRTARKQNSHSFRRSASASITLSAAHSAATGAFIYLFIYLSSQSAMTKHIIQLSVFHIQSTPFEGE